MYISKFRMTEKIYRIKSIKDVIKLQKKYDDNVVFEVIETGEEFTLPDLHYFYDGQDFDIRPKI